MFECDLHLHSIRSTCGFHTLFEIVDMMREKGFKGFALTDHGPALETPLAHFSVLLKRMPSFIEGMRLFKGIETSILNVEGDLDMPEIDGHSYEIILAGLHPHDLFSRSQGKKSNTNAILNAMKRHPSINILTHPCFSPLPVDIDAITDMAAETGTALEINNARLSLGRVDTGCLSRMLELARKKGNLLSVNSDGHVFSEMGNFDFSTEFMEQFDIDSLNIVNRTMESTLEFLELEA